MGETTNPTYTAPDGTYLDVQPAPADAPLGTVVLDVSGKPIRLAPMAVVSVIDLLAAPEPGTTLLISLGEDDDSPLLAFYVEEHGIDVHRTLDGRTTHQVTIPLARAYVTACEISAIGTRCA
ncbi:hypothetical protein [Nonomuraea basaltis]|uniref:hypothetical protein n=1 Tax=Nonomuraea basaltis TaxID=2495887 RepID=UPI00110C6F1D|nr:hypothetical protein [Nonomuraea basaltis]TMR88613.1 hypothetical protein EJK15_65305 [Nonomuraea basaltis]